MKHYKYLVPLLLIVMMGASFFSLINNRLAENDLYKEKIVEARKLAQLGVIEDSIVYYKEALSMKDSFSLALEIGKVYKDNGWLNDATNWGERIVASYPNEPEGYSFLLACYLEDTNYKDAFSLRTKAEKMNVENSSFKDQMRTIEYAFEYGWDYYDEVGEMNGGFCPVMDDGKWGYCDLEGSVKIKPRFEWAGPFSVDGVAAVKDSVDGYYYISSSGNKKVAIQNLKNVNQLSLTNNQILVACAKDQYGYYDFDFKQVISERYKYATIFNGDIAAVETSEGWKLINREGQTITKELYDGFKLDEKGIAMRNDREFALKDGYYFMLDTEGNVIGNDKYDDCKLFAEANGLAAVKMNGLWGFIDKEGKMVISPKFDDAKSFKAGLAAVKNDYQWGYIDSSGEVVIPAIYVDVKDFNEKGVAFVNVDSSWVTLKLLRTQS